MSNFRVLMVEDDGSLGRTIAAGLREDGFEIALARDLQAALHEMVRNRWEAFVVDLALPDGSGIDFILRARRHGLDTPILVLTASADSRTTVEALDAGADMYVVKPESIESIGARLRAMHRRATRQLGPVVRSGSVVLDPSRLTARVGSLEVDLTPTQARLLEALMAHAGMILTRDQLYDRIHVLPVPAGSNVVDVHVMQLRNKLGPLGGVLIETVRGAGYRFRRPE